MVIRQFGLRYPSTEIANRELRTDQEYLMDAKFRRVAADSSFYDKPVIFHLLS